MTRDFRCAGLIYGLEAHYIDHLAVLCQILEIPLICTEEEVARQASRYYPDLDVVFSDSLAIPQHLVSTYDLIFYAMPRDLFDEVFFFAQKLMQKKVHTLWCPHGNSDKGNQSIFMEALKKEEVALVYGPKMVRFLQQKGAFDQLKAHVVTGNYRYQFYQKHREFYDAIIAREILRRLPQGEKKVLYAPTWRDYEKSTSFYEALPHLVAHLPADWNLIVKLHPNLLLQDEHRVRQILETHEENPQVLFLTDFPPIYPLLQCADIYIGDMSSIGYDFLTFDRPMFFLNPQERDAKKDLGLYLFRCGTEIKPHEYPHIYQRIAEVAAFELRDFSKIRKEVYEETFGPPKDLPTLCREIRETFRVFPEKDLNFF